MLLSNYDCTKSFSITDIKEYVTCNHLLKHKNRGIIKVLTLEVNTTVFAVTLAS